MPAHDAVMSHAAASSPNPVRPFAGRFAALPAFYLLFLGVATATRVALTLKSATELGSLREVLTACAWGALFDLGAASLASLPFLVLVAALPGGWGRRPWHRLATVVGIFALCFGLYFGAAAEWFFWDEFGARFNFIAVDYLVYTHEVVGNIRESYDLPLILSAVAIGSALTVGLTLASGTVDAWLERSPASRQSRLAGGTVWLLVAAIFGAALDERHLPSLGNAYHRELAKNGVWSLFAAFKNNSLDYDQFYPTLPLERAFARLHRELQEDGAQVIAPDTRDTLRWVQATGAELHPNIIQITVESLSADFLGTFDPASKLTPNLDALAAKSLVFENFFATGNRTDRGMEALSLSLPPTPGRSMIKRPGNEDMFTLGSVLRTRGYDTAFIYGGYGYFDNMNYFFGQNGYRVIDRNDPRSDVTFANVWGACDEDLYRWTLREADASAATGRPFHYFVMTTSNHRPYTFPAGRIDLPSKVSGRAGAVKYTDFALGQFLREAAQKPWFKETVFVIVADHCASSAGRAELPVENYHIPLFIYAPGGQIAPGRIRRVTSQIDYAPTLLGLLNWSYASRFFGHDVRRQPAAVSHALIANYQKLGHLEDGHFVVLKPQREISHFRVDLQSKQLLSAPPDRAAEEEAISYYQSAHYLYANGLYRSTALAAPSRVMTAANGATSGTAGSPRFIPAPPAPRHFAARNAARVATGDTAPSVADAGALLP